MRAGIVAGDGGAVLWPLLMGVNRAKEYLITGDLLTAPEADRLGLTNHVVPLDPPRRRDGDGEAPRRRPPIAIRFNKRLVNKELEIRVSQLYDLSVALEAITFETSDHREAVKAFLDKRAPVFRPGEGTQA